METTWRSDGPSTRAGQGARFLSALRAVRKDFALSRVVDFLVGTGRDGAGRTVGDVLSLDASDLEGRHDFIQWLFPLATPSASVAGAPVLAPADVQAIRASTDAQASLRAGRAMMLRFYEASDHWLVPYDHNHRRISRIIGSLRLLVDADAADGFRDGILGIVERRDAPINPTTRAYWAAA
jgi:hypothetical protein